MSAAPPHAPSTAEAVAQFGQKQPVEPDIQFDAWPLPDLFVRAR